MRIGILSDTHDRLDRTLHAVEMLMAEGAEALVHCGDLTGPEIVYACGQRPSYFVFGNNDFNLLAIKRAIAEVRGTCLEWGGEAILASKRVAVAHGHLSRELRSLLEARPDYLLSGHSHQRMDRRDGPTRCINPGALHRATSFSVALLDLVSETLTFLPVAP